MARNYLEGWMSKMRVYELAKELRIDTKELVERLKDAGFTISNQMSALDEVDVGRAKDYLSGATSEIYEEKRIKPTVIRRRKKIIPKVQEPIEEEQPVIAEELGPAPEEAPKEEVKEAIEETVDKEIEGDVPAEQVPEGPKPEQVGVEPKIPDLRPKVVKKKKARPKTIPAKIIKMPDVPPPKPQIQEPTPVAPPIDTESTVHEVFQRETGVKKKRKEDVSELKEATAEGPLRGGS
jgi:translation initiation factor IF-2